MGEISIGERIKLARTRKKITQFELSMMIEKDRNFISLIEQDKRKIPAEILKKIAKALELPTSYFLENEGEMISLDDSSWDRFISELEKRGLMVVPRQPEREELSPDMMDLIQILKKDRAFFEYCKVVMRISKYPYLIDYATKFMESFIEIVNGVEKQTEERIKTAGKSNF